MEELNKRARATRPEKPVLGAMAMRKSTGDEMNEQGLKEWTWAEQPAAKKRMWFLELKKERERMEQQPDGEVNIDARKIARD
jgi:hypothetical protein